MLVMFVIATIYFLIMAGIRIYKNITKHRKEYELTFQETPLPNYFEALKRQDCEEMIEEEDFW